MKQTIFTVKENHTLAPGVCEMVLAGDASGITRPGQFVNIKLDGFFLRRPISVCDKGDGYVTIIYKVVGHGTEAMSLMESGQELDVLTGLGNGYDMTRAGERPLLIGGGVGVPPLYWLAKELVKSVHIKNPQNITVILGFNKKEEIFCEQKFKELGCSVHVATADGSYGTTGFVTDVFPEIAPKTSETGESDSGYTHFYACGPLPMLRAVCEGTKTDGQLSFEERMGCGFGACMGCSVKTTSGYKRICKDGPVLYKGEILW